MKLTIRPLTPDLWHAVEDLFGDSAVCSRCWCMYWRIGAASRKRRGTTNREAFREVVKRGPPPGLLAFDGDIPVGWCQLTPRDQVPKLDRAWRLKRVDNLPVWALSCFYVRKVLSQARHHLPPDHRGLEESEARTSACARSLPSG